MRQLKRGKRMTLASESVRYEAGGGVCGGRLVRPAATGKRRPAVLVFPEADGLGAHAIDRAERLARTGYVALAVDLHGDETQLTSIEEIRRAIEGFAAAPHGVLERATAALALISDQSDVDAERVGAIGFCYGGAVALELARGGAPLKGVVGFHPTLRPLITPPSPIRCPVLICVGSEDPFAMAEERLAFEAEMRAAGCDWQMVLFGRTKHSFTNRIVDARALPALAYNEQADATSWQAMEIFLDRHLGR
jgi:dienelactone hydrolase